MMEFAKFFTASSSIVPSSLSSKIYVCRQDLKKILNQNLQFFSIQTTSVKKKKRPLPLKSLSPVCLDPPLTCIRKKKKTSSTFLICHRFFPGEDVNMIIENKFASHG